MKKLLSLICLSFVWQAITAQSNVSLSVQYTLTSSWSGGCVANITVANHSTVTISSWQINFALGQGETITLIWNGTLTTNNQQVTIINESWNGALAPGATATVGVEMNTGSPTFGSLQAIGNPASTPVAPVSPILSAIAATGSNYTVSWNSVANATSYLLQQAANAQFSASTTAAQGNILSKSFTNQAIGTYYYRVNASNSAGTSPYSNTESVTISSSAPTAPATPTLNVITASGQNYTVSWNSVSGATSYTLQQATNSSFTSATTVAQGNVLSYAVTNQAAGTYYYRVSATNSAGTSAYSATQSVTIAATPTVPAAPTLNAITASGQNYTVSWNAVSGATSYTLQQATNSSFTSATTAAQGNVLSYAVTNQAAGTYYYRVSATNSAGTSAYSATQSVTISSSTPTTHPTIEGYWESWNSTDSISTIVGMHADIIDIAFATFQSNGNNSFTLTGINADQSTVTQLVTAAHAAGKKVKLSVGGASYPFSPFLTSAAAAQGMAQAVATYVQANNIDGVDYDIEDYPAANLQIALIQATRQLLPNALISYTPETPASSTSPYTQVIQGAYQYLNQINLMCYDAGPSYSYQSDISALIAMGIPASIIVIGLMPGADDEGKVTSVANIQTAADYILSQKLAGIMFWDLNRDHENITGLGVDAATDAAYAILQ